MLAVSSMRRAARSLAGRPACRRSWWLTTGRARPSDTSSDSSSGTGGHGVASDVPPPQLDATSLASAVEASTSAGTASMTALSVAGDGASTAWPTDFSSPEAAVDRASVCGWNCAFPSLTTVVTSDCTWPSASSRALKPSDLTGTEVSAATEDWSSSTESHSAVEVDDEAPHPPLEPLEDEELSSEQLASTPEANRTSRQAANARCMPTRSSVLATGGSPAADERAWAGTGSPSPGAGPAWGTNVLLAEPLGRCSPPRPGLDEVAVQ